MEHLAPLIHQILSKLPNLSPDELKDMQRAFAKQQKMKTLPSKSQILQTYFSLLKTWAIEKNADFEQLLKKRAIRSLSGIVSVQVLTKPRPCPGHCIFCPNDPTMPKSYIKSEPGAMRAFLNHFDPVKQVYNRLQSLTLTGHNPEKIEMIVLGGSRDAYPEEYRVEFVKGLYDACNTFDELVVTTPLTKGGGSVATGGSNEEGYRGVRQNEQQGMHQRTSPLDPIPSDTPPVRQDETKSEGGKWDTKYGFTILNEKEIQLSASLSEAMEKNQTAKHRIIGLTIETRPDLVTHEHCQQRRHLGVTRIEMGVQSTDDEILRLNKRGHTIQDVREAIHLMRQYGFKISLHLMPGLYGSNIEKDLQTFREVFRDPYLKPDELKIYPTSVIPNTELHRLYQTGEYQPITTEEILQEIRILFQEIIPPYTRIKRLIRDIPAPEIAAGSSITNLSQLAHEMLLREYSPNPIRPDSCRDTFPWEGKTVERTNGGSVAPYVQKFYERLRKSDDLITTTIVSSEEIIPLMRALHEDAGKGDQGGSDKRKIPPTPLYERGCYRNFVSLDTRSREVRNRPQSTNKGLQPLAPDTVDSQPLALNVVVRTYQSSVGQECFISYEDELGYLYGFIRLLLPSPDQTVDFPWLWKHTAIIRELHIYGELQKLGEKSEKATQHSGLGKKLLGFAEEMARKEGFSQLSVISGIGVREYYVKNGYTLNGTYVTKKL